MGAELDGPPARIGLGGADWRLRGFLGAEWRRAHLEAAHPEWLPAHVPGSVVDDLVSARQLRDPYHARNSLAAEWVAQRSWAYQRSFDVPPELAGTRLQLRLEGIDHEALVFLNGRRLGRHRGTFHPAAFDVADRLRFDGPNLLAVVVAPAPASEPQIGDTARVRAHKPRMSYGWDFCPRLVHQGLWDDVWLRATGPVRIERAFVRPTLDEPMRRARLSVTCTLDADAPGSATLAASVLMDGRRVAFEQGDVDVLPGERPADLELSLEAPAIWWPNGAGDQPLYALELSAAVDGRVSDRYVTRFGVRRVELVRGNATGDSGRPLTFVVNGRRTYVNGWNWVPLDMCYGVPRPARQAHLLRLARRANVNLLRVWGGGLIERDDFYDRCDDLGLMVWQEFSQSSSGFGSRPSRAPAFVRTMATDAEAIVPRRRNHASLVVWCGGNELADGSGTPLDETEPVLGALAEAVRRLDPDRGWLPTSPSGPGHLHGPWEHQGLGAHEAHYDASDAVLHSEFGVEGMANRATIDATIEPHDRWPSTRDSPAWAHRGSWWINEPLVQAAFGGGIGDLDGLIRASQYLQASGLAYAVDAGRRRQPRSVGVIPWQLNEPFPNGWCTSAIDYYGRPKPAFAAVAAAYAPLAVSARFASPALAGGDRLAVEAWAVSALTDAVDVRLEALLVDAAGRELARDARLASVPAGAAACLAPLSWQLPDDADDLLLVSLTARGEDGGPAAARRYLFSRTADLAPMRRLPPTALTVRRRAAGDGWRVTLRNDGERLALLVRLEDARPAGATGWPLPADDSLLLLPGEERMVDVAWHDVPRAERRLRVGGWNTAEIILG